MLFHRLTVPFVLLACGVLADQSEPTGTSTTTIYVTVTSYTPEELAVIAYESLASVSSVSALLEENRNVRSISDDLLHATGLVALASSNSNSSLLTSATVTPSTNYSKTGFYNTSIDLSTATVEMNVTFRSTVVSIKSLHPSHSTDTYFFTSSSSESSSQSELSQTAAATSESTTNSSSAGVAAGLVAANGVIIGAIGGVILGLI
ncbi:uncharacterized protein Ecym_4432 [Eremothecium cymbalariae DBVPG|uniref:Uncharacterized protein n=1 Tax=Eremothecium cymbalariae (strain CBS 270.75 / DBVPG 7215 / KCTC 17166 / NRRL Y-17582) TaxID=931890 RepID=G8JTX5_ERECY|nr:hypothetical protein Ecym_4432 [Eremothecium cymbalariae DBVPG\